MPDKFPEAFERFEKSVKLDKQDVKTINELNIMFFNWAKDKAPMTKKQREAIKVEAVKRGIQYRRERIPLKKGGYYYKYRDMSNGRFAKNPIGN